MSHHLAVLRKLYLDRILSGSKTIECRFSRTRRPPFGAVRAGDRIWLKLSGGPVVATAHARSVKFLHPLGAAELRDLRLRYGDSIHASRSFFHAHAQANFATLIALRAVVRIEPFEISKSDRRAWVVLTGPPVPKA